MAIEICLVDGTKFIVDDSVESFTKETPPTAGWVYINEGDDTPKRYFNPANIAYVIEVEESDGMPLIETFPR